MIFHIKNMYVCVSWYFFIMIGWVILTNKTKVFSCNDSDFKLLKNGWFISDGSLYDDTGTFFIGKEDGIELPLVYLIFIGFLMPKIRL